MSLRNVTSKISLSCKRDAIMHDMKEFITGVNSNVTLTD